MAVVEHGTIDHSLVLIGKMFQVLIVSRDYTKSHLLPKLFQHGFGYGTANKRFGTATKLIDE